MASIRPAVAERPCCGRYQNVDLRLSLNVLLSPIPAVFPRNFIDDLFKRYFDALKDVAPFYIAALFVVWALCSPRLRTHLLRIRKSVRAVIVLALCAIAIAWGWSLLWASDDAYISFRYAENLVRGHGLVFNPGERVEGYTDFLWTLIAAIAIALKIDPGHATVVLNLLSFGGLIVLVERLGTRLKSSPTLIGIATVFVATNYTLASFSTACIETMFAAMLSTWALERVDAGKPLLGGLLGIAATLTHPDHGIFYVVLAVSLLADPNRRRQLARYLIPFFAVLVPYVIWKRHYYGAWMPNTYYAKSAEKTYFEQGFVYLLITIIGSGLWLTLPLMIVGGVYTRRSLIGRYSLLVLPIYLGYVAKVGGDFMLGRFFVPALPLWFLLADAGYRALLSKNHWRWAITLLIPAAAVALPINVVKAGELYHGVADERTFGGVDEFSTMHVGSLGYLFGHALFDKLKSKHIEPRVAVWSVGMSGYYSKLPMFDLRGLTTRSVAHIPILRRGRPGHEKIASPALIVEDGVQLSELALFPQPFANLSALSISGDPFHLVRYDQALIRMLPSNTGLIAFPEYLDSHTPSIRLESEQDLDCDLWHLWEYYFSINNDPARRKKTIEAALKAKPSLAGSERALLVGEDLSPFGFRRVRSFSFEVNEAPWTAEGDAGYWLTSELRPDQEVPLGRKGRFVNTFLPPDADLPTGKMISPPFTIEGDVLTFMIGGGKEPDSERIELLVDGQVVRKATACNSEWMGQRVWNISMFRGKSAKLVIKDASSGVWGHLLVDEIVEWRATQ